MGFWIFMFIMELILPLMMTGFGVWFQKSPPRQINYVFGYRTKMSMKNIETWNFAHYCCGRHWYRIGRITLLATIAAMLPVIGKDEYTVGNYGAVLMVIQAALLIILPILLTERELRMQFDADGNKRLK